MPSEFTLRVYYEDTDAGGVVYYANYLKFAERARTEALRAAGIGQENLLREQGIAFVVRSCNAEFLKPARLDDLLTIETRLHDIGNASLTMQQRVMRESVPLVDLTVKIGVVSAEMRPTRLPPALREALASIF
jgi:acyl-CoA thioester hydrolase